MKKPMQDMMMKEKFDNLYTPYYAVKPLRKYFTEYTSEIMWEPCDPGNSNITKFMREEMGYNVISTDLVTGENFLESKKGDIDFDLIVTNPPYSLKDKFIEKCYELGKPFALLLPLTALEGIHRSSLFQEYGISVVVLDRRVDFTGKGNNWFNVSWFIWKPSSMVNRIYFENVDKEGVF